MLREKFAIAFVVMVFFIPLSIANVPPKADFYYSPELPHTMETVYFYDNSSDPDGYVIEWQWDFGDGNISYEKNTAHVYKKAGKYNVTLTIVDNEGMPDAITKQIVIRNREPIIRFFWTKEGYEIKFIDASYDIDGNIVNYTWDFGDGNISYEKNPSHRYAKDGIYNVRLIVRDDDGGINETVKAIDTLNKLPIVDFSWTPLYPTDLEYVNFTCFGYDIDGNIVNYTWDFGDGNISYEKNPSHRYGDDGVYKVMLTLIDDDFALQNLTKEIIIYNVKPVANFFYSPSYPIPNRNITFNASLSYDLDGYIANYTWNFGDGNISYGKVVKHQYSKHGVYEVILTVYDDDGDYHSISKRLLVADVYVDKNIYAPQNNIWNKIQDAIDNCSDGYMVVINEGIYYESVYINKEIEILGKNASVYGGNYSFYIDRKVEIKNITARANTSFVMKCNKSIIKNCKIIDSNVAFEIFGNRNRITQNSIEGITSFIIYGDENIISKNVIKGNTYGIKVYGKYNTISENNLTAIYGVYLENINNEIENNIIKGCQYGIYTINANIIVSNIIMLNGYGIFIENHCNLGYNEFKENYYGIYTTASRITKAVFYDNEYSIKADYADIINVTIVGGNFGIDINDGKIEGSYIETNNGILLRGGVEIKRCEFKSNIGIQGNGYGVIKNCEFLENEIGIYEINGSIENCYFYKNTYGIKALNSSIYNSSFEKNEYAILLENENKIIYSSFVYNKFSIYIGGIGNEIKSNDIEKNENAIVVENSFNSIEENYIKNNTYGIKVLSSPHNYFYANNLMENRYNLYVTGSKLEHFYQNMEGNKIDGKDVLYFTNISNYSIEGIAGYLALINCNNISVDSISISNNGNSLLIVESEGIKIEKCNLSDSIYGIYCLNALNVSIYETCAKNNSNGFSFKSSENIRIENCNFYENLKGVNIFNIEKRETKAEIINCYMAKNIFAINIENIYNFSILNTSFERNDMLRIYNSNGSFMNCHFHKNGEIQIKESNVEMLASKIDNCIGINLINSFIEINRSIINSSNIAIKSENSEVKIFESKLHDNNVSLKILNSNLYIYNSSFDENKENNISSSNIEIKNSSFFENKQALKIIKSNGFIFNCRFNINEYSIYLINSFISIINLSLYENENGIILNGNSEIKGGEYYNNTIAIIIEGNNSKVEKILFHHNNKAIELYGNKNEILNCSFWKNFYGLIAYGENNTIYHNNFIYNIENAIEYGKNRWNSSYPEGGNYWYDYDGIDLFKGENQDILGKDGIGDTPYELNGNVDNYPLMNMCRKAALPPNIPPSAAFYFYPKEPFSMEEIIFMDASYDENGLEDIIFWHWNFGDGSYSSEKNPRHSYSKPGKYNVTLTIKDRANASDSIKLQIMVKNIPPYANFSYTPYEIYSYDEIEFNASLSYDKDGYISNYTWYFGDGSIAYGKIVKHKYVKSGNYEVLLKVIDDMGNESEKKVNIKIMNKNPEAKFIFTPKNPKAGEEIEFSDLSNDIDGSIISWHWNFGDGSISYKENPKHVYKKAGKYKVELIVKDNEGGKGNYSMIIEIEEKEMPAFEIVLISIALVVTFAKKRKLRKNI